MDPEREPLLSPLWADPDNQQNMQANRNFIIFFTIVFLSTNPHLLLASTIQVKHPKNIKGNESDREALLAIKAEISNVGDSILSSWNNSYHFCQWRGVTCSRRHTRVLGLNLSSNNLVGTLSPFIGNLSFLHKIDIGNNSFRGHIPRQISKLPRLRIIVLTTNSFEGEIPSNLSRCFNLFSLDLSRNKLEGRIPTKLATLPYMADFRLYKNKLSGRLQAIGIGNMSSSLKTLYLHDNELEGNIPNDIGRLKGLSFLTLGRNKLYGTIPTSLFNLSNLKELDLAMTNIHGVLPQDLGLRLSQLQYLYLAYTFFTGKLPTLSNLTQLISLDIPYNYFEGEFSLNGNNLPQLMHINIFFAFSSQGNARDMSFIDTLTNCTNLVRLLTGGNSFAGVFPRSILNLSSTLTVLDIGKNQMLGQLPSGLAKFVNLRTLDLEYNQFIGPVPYDIGKLESIQLLYMDNNNFSGNIPSSLGNLTLLSTLSMQNNNLQGSIPKSFQNSKNLQYMLLSSNKLSGALPVELFHSLNLINIDIGQNNLQGSLPIEIGSQKNLVRLVVSQNRFSGNIPNTLGGCTSLVTLNMSKNSFSGSIPESLSPLKSIQQFDLSWNNLSGQIPSYFSSWPYLLSLNVSFNNLEGEVPTSGVFANASVVLVVGNSKLCGGAVELHLPRCPSPKESERKRLSKALVVIISIACVLIVVASIAIFLYLLSSSRKRKDESMEFPNIKPFLEVSYQMLSRATNAFSPSNLIGVGGFGSVYKGILQQDSMEMEVAVKVLNLQNQRASKSFIAECKVLRDIRHRNLVKIITACSSIDTQRNDFKALVYEYMSKGSLETWLHSNPVTEEQSGDIQPFTLSLIQRLNIAIDVASALEYLHIGCANPISYSDLKPANILLDDEMTAHLGDFGLAKFLSGASTSKETSSTQVRGTIGYAAPEYGLGSNVSPEGDVYGFGIVVLELMTSKKPTDPMFNEGLNLHDFAKSALSDRLIDVIDKRILDDTNVLFARSVGDIGFCSLEISLRIVLDPKPRVSDLAFFVGLLV